LPSSVVKKEASTGRWEKPTLKGREEGKEGEDREKKKVNIPAVRVFLATGGSTWRKESRGGEKSSTSL